MLFRVDPCELAGISQLSSSTHVEDMGTFCVECLRGIEQASVTIRSLLPREEVEPVNKANRR